MWGGLRTIPHVGIQGPRHLLPMNLPPFTSLGSPTQLGTEKEQKDYLRPQGPGLTGAYDSATILWLQLCHLATPNCKGGWEANGVPSRMVTE